MKNEQQITNGNGLPPLGLQAATSQSEGGQGNKKGRKHIGLLIVGGIVLVGAVLAGGYYSLARKPRIAFNSETCTNITNEDECNRKVDTWKGHKNTRLCVWRNNKCQPIWASAYNGTGGGDRVKKRGNWYRCTGTSDENCQGKKPGESCMGGNGTCSIVKDYHDNDGLSGPISADCSCRSKTCTGGVSHGCGLAPKHIPPYHKTANIGPFPEDGKLVVFFQPLNVDGGGGVKAVVINYKGKEHTIQIKSGRQRIVTNIQIKKGETAKLVRVIEREQHDKCAPHDKPYQGIGWIPVNNDLTCGSGLMGPPQGGRCEPYPKRSVREAIEWAKSFQRPILSKECWADWMEWPGDYDFEDYFLMFSYVPTGVSCDLLNKDKNVIEVGDTVKFTCKGTNASGEGKLKYEFRYLVDDGKTYQPLKYRPIETVKGNVAILKVTIPGTYEVQCRVCLTGTNICSANWLPAEAK